MRLAVIQSLKHSPSLWERGDAGIVGSAQLDDLGWSGQSLNRQCVGILLPPNGAVKEEIF